MLIKIIKFLIRLFRGDETIEKTKVKYRENIFNDRQALLTIYIENEARIRDHRKILWEEARHFTWLISITLSGAGYILIQAGNYIFFSWVLSIVATIVTNTAIDVIQRERQEFLRALILSRKIEKLLGLHEPIQDKILGDVPFNKYIFSRSGHVNIFKEMKDGMATHDVENQEAEGKTAEEVWMESITKGFIHKRFNVLFYVYGFTALVLVFWNSMLLAKYIFNSFKRLF